MALGARWLRATVLALAIALTIARPTGVGAVAVSPGLWLWGGNFSHQLCSSATVNMATSPTTVAGLTNVVSSLRVRSTSPQ